MSGDGEVAGAADNLFSASNLPTISYSLVRSETKDWVTTPNFTVTSVRSM